MSLFVCGSIFAVGERTVSLGGSAAWNSIETRSGITEARDVRQSPVLLLTSTAEGYSAATGVLGTFSSLPEPALDLYISFDERAPGNFFESTGRYRVFAPANIERVDRSMARGGLGAVLFGNSASYITVTPQSRNALFAPGNRIGDFSIEFWLYPLNLENGERIFSWVSQNENNATQRIQCTASRNRLFWSFTNFFTSINGNSTINLEFSGNAPIVPKTWSHHLIRFDAKTGMLEYLVDGNSEAVSYATSSRRENNEVFIPISGQNGSFLLGESFKGIMDEFKIHSVFAGRSSVQKYPSAGGRIESRAIDLGEITSTVTKIDVTGGRAGNRGAIINEFRENGNFRFSDDTQMQFFVRSSDNPWSFNSKPWVSFIPGQDISGIRGRYVQVAANFYPSANGEVSPYLEQIRIVYLPGEPPLPPRNVTAIAGDSAVQLRWRPSPSTSTSGYLVYYSAVRGELFGTDAVLGASPIDVGMTNSVTIEGLRNGVLYYFRVVGYERVEGSDRLIAGEFSAEVTARPLIH